MLFPDCNLYILSTLCVCSHRCTTNITSLIVIYSREWIIINNTIIWTLFNTQWLIDVFLLLRRLLILVLMSLTIGATIFDYVAYSEQMTWQWNKGMCLSNAPHSRDRLWQTDRKSYKTNVGKCISRDIYFWVRIRVKNLKRVFFSFFPEPRSVDLIMCFSGRRAMQSLKNRSCVIRGLDLTPLCGTTTISMILIIIGHRWGFRLPGPLQNYEANEQVCILKRFVLLKSPRFNDYNNTRV